MNWWKLTFEPNTTLECGDQLDTLGFELMDMGAASTVVEDFPKISCFVQGDAAQVQNFATQSETLGLRAVGCEEVRDENWHQGCSEVWQPIVAGTLTIVPVVSSDDARPSPSGALRIIPGQGFGTGHHPTTRMILQALSRLYGQGVRPRGEILDLGTGSGILALAAAKLFSNPIVGTDIEEAALENARDNVLMNERSGAIPPKTIRLENLPLSSFQTPFGMILANVYGEVLVELAGEVLRLAAPGSFVILSGITELVRDQVVAAYSEANWEIEEERSEDDWVCLVLIRR